jgi:hypothetical protein
MRRIKSYNEFGKVNEMTEFNLQRFNQDSVRASIHVDDPNLSTNAFDKHQDMIRQAMSRVNDILHNLSGTNAYSALRSKLALEDQNISDIKILRISKVNNISYDVYITFKIGETEYWGVIENIMSVEPQFKSEVFKDFDLYQSKEWVIKTKGLIIKTLKEWLKPSPGTYKLINNEVICYSTETGKQLRMKNGIEIELVRSHSDKIIIRYEGDTYNLIGDNYVYFNWWFEKIN